MCLMGAAQAQERLYWVSGKELQQTCETDAQVCIGFITGVSDALEALAWPRPRTCRPDAVTRDEVLRVAQGALMAAPSRAAGPAFDILADAFVAEWPC